MAENVWKIIGCEETLSREMEESNFSKNDILEVLKRSGEAKKKTRIYEAWKEGHEQQKGKEVHEEKSTNYRTE